MSLLDISKRAVDRDRYESLESILVSMSERKEAPMDFYRNLFPDGCFGMSLGASERDGDGEYVHDGMSFGIFGVIPDNEMYKKMKLWIDEKNNIVSSTPHYGYSLNKEEQERMMRFYILGDKAEDNRLVKPDGYFNSDSLSLLSDDEFSAELQPIEALSGFGECKPLPDIKYPDMPCLLPSATRSERQKAIMRHRLACARVEYAFDRRYEKLDAAFHARCYRNIQQIDEKERIYGRIQADWMYQQRVDNSLRQIGLCFGQQSCVMRPLDFFGRKAVRRNAGNLYAVALDVDDIKPEKLQECFDMDFYGFRPTYVVQSGTGLHFYYFLSEPLPMLYTYRSKITQLKQMLLRLFVNLDMSYTKQDGDKQTWFEGFRVVGSKSKVFGKFVEAYLVGDVWNISDLAHMVHLTNKSAKLNEFDDWVLKAKTNMTRAEWLKKQEIIKNLRDTFKSNNSELGLKGSGFITRNRGFYDSWCERIQSPDALFSRYYRTCILFADAAYCRIPYEEVLKFAETELYNYFNLPYIAKGNPFYKSDIVAASKFYDTAKNNKAPSLKMIEDWTHIHLEPSKRNGRSQKNHCAFMRSVRDIKIKQGTCKDTHFGAEDGNLAGRKSSEQIVRDYLQEHPEARKVDVVYGTGLTKPTVYKWYDKIKKVVNPNETDEGIER